MSDGDFQRIDEPIVLRTPREPLHKVSAKSGYIVGQEVLKASIQAMADNYPNDADLGKAVRSWANGTYTSASNEQTNE